MAEAMRQVILYPDREDGGWVALVPSLPGCVSEGQTREEALKNVREAIGEWMDLARRHGDEIPEETFEAQAYVVDVHEPTAAGAA